MGLAHAARSLPPRLDPRDLGGDRRRRAVGSIDAFHLVVVDVLLLRLRLRALPTGVRAWFSGLLAPIATVAAWMVLPSGDGGARSVLTIGLGFMLGALVVRLLLGKRPTA